MVRRFKKRQRTGEQTDGQRLERGKFGLVWLVLALAVLAAVIFYDQRGMKEAREHMQIARELDLHGEYKEALKEYQSALGNVRLPRRAKGEIALAIADIHFSRLGNYSAAVRYYGEAKQDNPRLFHSANAHERMKQAAERANGSAVRSDTLASDGANTSSTRQFVERVELMQAPAGDKAGPVMAVYNGGEIRGGEILRTLRGTPEFNDPEFRNDPAKLQEFLKTHLKRVIHYEAALSANLQNEPSVMSRLYEYQRSLLAERFASETKREALTISNKQVEDYYSQHTLDYNKPGAFRLAMIKTSTKDTAQQASDSLRSGAVFGDVATSLSLDKLSAERKGDVGEVARNATDIPGIGKAPELVAELQDMKPGTVSAITPFDGSFFIFKILQVIPETSVTLEQARPDIEMKLRSTSYDGVTKGLDKKLTDRFQPEINRDNLLKFWEFVDTTRDNQSTKSLSTSSSVSTARADSSTTVTGGVR